MAEQLLTECQAAYNCIDSVARVLGKEYGLPGLAVERGKVDEMAAEYCWKLMQNYWGAEGNNENNVVLLRVGTIAGLLLK